MKDLQTIFILVFLFLSSSIYGQTITICYQDGGSFDPLDSTVIRKLINPVNFGPGGAICHYSFQAQAIADGFTEATLNANNCSIWWSTFEPDANYTASELTELGNWLANGGVTIASFDNEAFNPVPQMLGILTHGFSGGTGSSETTSEGDACFPNVGSGSLIGVSGSSDGFLAGSFPGYQVLARSHTDANNAVPPNIPTIISKEGILVATNSTIFTGLSSGNELSTTNDFFLADGICALASSSEGNSNCLTSCDAGSTAPALSATTITNSCPTATVDLTSITASNTPAGTNLTWHTATPATTANKITDPTALAAAGTYYAVFHDTTNDCYGGASGNATTAVTVTLTVCCDAGSTIPALSATTITNSCPTVTVDLTSITASNTPAGTNLTWHTATPATTANKIANPTVQAATGTYYAAYYDATNDCYGGASGNATTAVTASSAACCNAGSAAPILIKN